MNGIHKEELYNKEILSNNDEKELREREQQIMNDLEEYMNYLRMNYLRIPYI